MPIRPDYVGRNIPTSHQEEITVHMVEIDGQDEVAIIGPDAVASGRQVNSPGQSRRS